MGEVVGSDSNSGGDRPYTNVIQCSLRKQPLYPLHFFYYRKRNTQFGCCKKKIHGSNYSFGSYYAYGGYFPSVFCVFRYSFKSAG